MVLHKRRLSVFRNVRAAAVVIPLLSCSPLSESTGGEFRDGVAFEEAARPLGTIDASIKQQSEALHSFLVGQISLQNEDFEEALKSFKRTSELSGGTVPLVQTRLAELEIRAGNLEGALVECNKALGEDPGNPQLLQLKAGILDSLNRETEAEPIYLELTNKHPNLLEPFVLLAGLYGRQQKSEQALEILRKLLSLRPDEVMAHRYAARAFEQLGRFKDAVTHLQTAIRLDPSETAIKVDLVRVYLKSKQLDQAKMLCVAILDKEPNNVAARRVLGQMMLGENRFEEALQHLKVLEGIEEDPTETRYKMALVAMERQDFKEGARQLSLVLAKRPKHYEARYYLATLLGASGNIEEAVTELDRIDPDSELYVKSRMFAAFLLRQSGELERSEAAARQALDRAPADRQILLFIVAVLKEREELDEARSLLQEGLKDDPKNERLLLGLGALLADMGEEDEARSVMHRVVETNPKNGDALNFLAYSYAERGEELERAEQLVRRALELRPDDGYYLDTLGWVLFRKNSLQEAFDILVKASARTGDDPVVAEHLGEVALKLGKIERAIQAFVDGTTKPVEPKQRDSVEAIERMRSRLRELYAEYPQFERRGAGGG